LALASALKADAHDIERLGEAFRHAEHVVRRQRAREPVVGGHRPFIRIPVRHQLVTLQLEMDPGRKWAGQFRFLALNFQHAVFNRYLTRWESLLVSCQLAT